MANKLKFFLLRALLRRVDPGRLTRRELLLMVDLLGGAMGNDVAEGKFDTRGHLTDD